MIFELSNKFTITPVIESPIRSHNIPWPTLDVPELSRVVLDAKSLECMGTFMAAICYGVEVESLSDFVAYIHEESNFENSEPPIRGSIFAEGGFVFNADGVVVAPACCGSLGKWWEWRCLLQSGESPYFGHDPAGSATRHSDRVEIFQGAADEPKITIPILVFEEALGGAESKIISFFDSLPNWFASVGLCLDSDVIPLLRWHFWIDDRPSETK